MSPSTTDLPFDVLIVGSGIAGCAVALHLADETGARIGLVTKANVSDSATAWAQGGIASVTSPQNDTFELHFLDTVRAGAGLCDETATRVLVEEGPRCVADLASWGANFDRLSDGTLELAREGGHSVARIVHAGGVETGAEVARALIAALLRSDVVVLESRFVLDLVVEHGRCVGLEYVDGEGALSRICASIVVLATGGAGQLFDVTTNPPESTADGLAMALRAGVPVADVEFMQFHPTALVACVLPRPVLSEARRGHGAILRNKAGERFVDELAPRDVVSRAIADQMMRDGSDHVFLDVSGLSDFASRFPNIAEVLFSLGIDPVAQWLCVAPAAHYLSGGVLTDLDGASALPGLFAVGEVACTGVQGANRLASNSLLEGLVFGTRAARAIGKGRDSAEATGALCGLLRPEVKVPISVRTLNDVRFATPGAPRSTDARSDMASLIAARSAMQQAMSLGAGIVRDRSGLQATYAALDGALATAYAMNPYDPSAIEVVNLATVGSALVSSALCREESRGAHSRSDYPQTNDEVFRCRLAIISHAPARSAVPHKVDPS